ncbi:SUMF1/EgtB/PvdO family nonheme iron enzyme [Donghicola mangrovi]|uniref:SUMF1/EgtB/PvdO family nonheme iron enzyme n=1 Tax=Donghicola mangrovi TaxID=2729614 RepID=A0A850Q7W6_9RHOB|nr:SUMF1/EgtB/PvdO family nonheme iron enzyme [Donghicola mangrovi]NVO22625.1 SUMF1/EgtB/PvdO family nonheme iron enzyme [Donghicola mangrovi]
MIHWAAANAVGEVFINGIVKGHCVLIGPYMAVTCAHVLSDATVKPDIEAVLRFPRLNFEAKATISGWRAFDRSLAPGTDIALLTLAGEAPANSWRPMEARRPVYDADVVSLEYLTARCDGDPRAASVQYGEGSVISLTGRRFSDPGMSGTGLFYCDQGERLLGIVAGRPKSEGQTEAYAIPADEIQKLLADCADKPVVDVSLDLFQVLTECFLAEVSENLHSLVQIHVQAATKVLGKPSEVWTEYDIQDLCCLHSTMERAGYGGVGLPKGVAEALTCLSTLTAELTYDADHCLVAIPVDVETRQKLEALKNNLIAFRQSPFFPEQATQPADTLILEISTSIVFEHLLPLQLSNCNANLQKAAGDVYCGLGRVLPALLGRRADLLPPGTIFADSLELWAPEMVVMPMGRFLMGSLEHEEDRDNNEGPQHEVVIDRPFALARFALTFEEYDLFSEAAGRSKPIDGSTGRDRHPVFNVSWNAAHVWCDWISRKTGATWRLPSEAEWEYACRAGTRTRYFHGDEITTDEANFDGSQIGETYRMKMTPVDHPEFRGNGFGLWQMHGNVYEWCADDWSDDYSSPRTQLALIEQPRTVYKAIRGGSNSSHPRDLRSASRDRYYSSNSSYSVGFRPARSLLPL